MTRMRLILLMLACCGGLDAVADGWGHYGGDLAGTRFVANSEISAGNAASLRVAWQFRTGDMSDGSDHAGRLSTFKATPILVDGRLIFSSGFNRVFAVDAADGTPLWTFDPRVDFSTGYSEMFTSRGVSAWKSGDPGDSCASRVLLGTLDARLIAIDAATGEPCTGFGENGEIDLSRGIANYRHGEYSITSPVTVVNDVVVVGSSIGDNGGVQLEPGIVRGFAAESGALLWRWDPVPRSADAPGAETWGPRGGGTGAANVWSVISADAARDLIFLPTTSPSPDFYGGKRPGRNRYANSVVALSTGSGKPVWDFQLVHHDLWDYDLAAQPLLLDIERDSARLPVVVQASKMGHVFVLDRKTGEPVFAVEERPVPQSDVPGEASAATQPIPVRPPPLHSKEVALWDFSPEHLAFCKALLDGVRADGIFTPPSLGGTLLFPGNGGGTNWGSMAADPGRRIAVLAVNRMPTIVTLIPRAEFDERRSAAADDPLDIQYTAQSGTPYGMARFDLYNPSLGLPCLEGPWGELVALDLQQGSVLWRRPLGTLPGVEGHPEASNWGSMSAGGPIVTSTGLVFIAPRFGHELLAYRLTDGAVVWRGQLPAMATATPMSYVIDGEQYVVIAAGGDVIGDEPPGDYLVAFKLADAG